MDVPLGQDATEDTTDLDPPSRLAQLVRLIDCMPIERPRGGNEHSSADHRRHPSFIDALRLSSSCEQTIVTGFTVGKVQ